MNQRPLGLTGLMVSEVGFGCGGTGGLMGRGTQAERLDVVGRALELGINYFDTAPDYDATLSEANLGQTLKELGARPVVGTKVRLLGSQLDDIPGNVTRSVEASLKRLQLDCIDLIQLHNHPARQRYAHDHATIAVEDILGEGGVLETLQRLRDAGKVRFFGFTGIGEPDALHQVIDRGGFQSVQAYYNLLNPSAGRLVPVAFRNADYRQIIDRAGAQGMGVLGIRPLAAGALTGTSELHPLAGGWSRRAWFEVAADRAKAQALDFLLADGRRSLEDAAVRFVLMKPQVSSVLIGFSSREQLEQGLRSAAAPDITDEELAQLDELYHAD